MHLNFIVDVTIYKNVKIYLSVAIMKAALF